MWTQGNISQCCFTLNSSRLLSPVTEAHLLTRCGFCESCWRASGALDRRAAQRCWTPVLQRLTNSSSPFSVSSINNTNTFGKKWQKLLNVPGGTCYWSTTVPHKNTTYVHSMWRDCLTTPKYLGMLLLAACSLHWDSPADILSSQDSQGSWQPWWELLILVHLDKASRPSIINVIWILSSDTI